MSSQNCRQAILEPADFVTYTLRRKLAQLKAYESVLFCFDPDTYAKLKRRFQGQVFRGLTGELYLMRNRVALAGKFGIGCPSVAAFMEELIACGMHRFIGLGTAGALQPGRPMAEVILCSGALSDEGTSRHYPGFQRLAKPSPKLTSQLDRWFAARRLPFARRRAWTTDAPYRETMEKLDRFLAAGAEVVEMEASAMFNVARFRKVTLAHVFVVGDSIANGKWSPGFHSGAVKRNSFRVAEELVRFLLTSPR